MGINLTPVPTSARIVFAIGDIVSYEDAQNLGMFASVTHVIVGANADDEKLQLRRFDGQTDIAIAADCKLERSIAELRS